MGVGGLAQLLGARAGVRRLGFAISAVMSPQLARTIGELPEAE